MRHLIVSRELPPASYPAGGIGTYVANIAELLATHGDVVHLIGERWDGAPNPRETRFDGRMVIHRIGPRDVPDPGEPRGARMRRELQGLQESVLPAQWFAWSAASLIERLVEEEGIDVIEAQEWEAPLYYFLLRRSLGLGPDRRPPCAVHLHSPSVFIHKYNGPSKPRTSLNILTRMEEFCIKSADALLCPSRGLAGAVARRYRLQPDAIEVIPLPLGSVAEIERAPAVWSDGAVCYVGRLEPRKGVIEWVDAAICVAREDPAAHFDFVGADSWNLKTELVKRIGPELGPRFRFYGPQSKADIAAHLGRAKAGVVPSRWENFPNVCIEAMASGLPVIATRNGGMAELLEDERSGWLAEDAGVAGMVDSLAEALRRCLATPAERKAKMGAAAARTVRRICDNDVVLAAHQRFRAGLAQRGAVRASLPGAVRLDPSVNVVVRAEALLAAKGVLRSLHAQSRPAKAIAVVHRQAAPRGWLDEAPPASRTDVVLEHAPELVGTQAWNHGFAVLDARQGADFWLFLDEHDLLEPECLERMARIFAGRPDVGLISPWTDRMDRHALDARPSPALPYQLTGNDVAPASAFRTQALAPSRPFRPGLPREYDVWALANEVIARGWTAVTLPGLHARRSAPPMQLSWLQATSLRAIRAEALAPFDNDENETALQLVDAYVALPQPPREPYPTDARFRRFLLQKFEAVLFRPGHVVRRCVGLVPRLPGRGAASP